MVGIAITIRKETPSVLIFTLLDEVNQDYDEANAMDSDILSAVAEKVFPLFKHLVSDTYQMLCVREEVIKTMITLYPSRFSGVVLARRATWNDTRKEYDYQVVSSTGVIPFDRFPPPQ